MLRKFVCALLAVVLSVGVLLAEQIKGKIKKLDPDKGTLVLSVDGKDQTHKLSRATKVLDADGKEIEAGLGSSALKPGVEVTIITEKTGKKTQGVKELRLNQK